MKILITAFLPFDNQKSNISLEVLNQITPLNNLIKVVLPVLYFESFQLLKEVIIREKPGIIILLGEARSYQSVGFEVIGINTHNYKEDSSGLVLSSSKIVMDGPDGLFSSLDYQAFKESFTLSKVAFHRSFSAGTYVCNALLYQTLLFLKEQHILAQCGFIHLPILAGKEVLKVAEGFNQYLKRLISHSAK